MNKRKLNLPVFAFSIIIGLSLLAGCSRKSDACATQYCNNGGTCSDGSCSCPGNFTGVHCDSCKNGYEGSDCNTQSRTKFLYAGYAVNETVSGSTSGTRTYTASILNSNTQIDQVYISHLSNGFFLNSVAATCRGNNLTIATQQPDAGSPQSISGSGIYTSSGIYITYTIVDSSNGNSYNCVGTWTR